MINLTFEQAVSGYLLTCMAIFAAAMAFSLFRAEKKNVFKESHLWQCSICAFVYSSLFDKNITVCPQCGSYNKKEGDS